MNWYQHRRSLGIIGTVLVIAALTVAIAANIHITGLPVRPLSCSRIDCTDEIYDLRTPYAWFAFAAAVAWFIGFLLLSSARPSRTVLGAVPEARGWKRPGFLLLVGLLLGVVVPWLLVMFGQVSRGVPRIALLLMLATATVHITLWWWLRSRSGKDRAAWSAAFAIQIIGSLLLVALLVTPQLPIGLQFLPVIQLLIYLGGTRIAVGALRTDATQDERRVQSSPSGPVPTLVVRLTVGFIAIATIWAAWPQPVSDVLQARIERGNWPLKTTDRQTSWVPSPSNQSPAPSPSSTPTAPPTGSPSKTAPQCTAEVLDVTIDGWDAATGIRAASINVTNENGEAACELRGRPDFRVLQSAEDLHLEVTDLEPYREVAETVQPDMVLDPGESARALLYWRGERSAYDDDSAQLAQVRFDELWVDARFEFYGPSATSESPIDLVPNGTIEIGQWSSP